MATIDAPMVGKIVAINVEVGQAVTEDDEAFVLESMKMENPIYPMENGTVKAINVKVGDVVNMGDVLAELE
jgi:biotin carboxyl carrier protein